MEARPTTVALDAPAGLSGFTLEELVIVVDFGTEAVGYPVKEVQRLGVINDVVAGLEIAVVSDPADPQRWSVFSRRLDEEVVDLEVNDGRIIDVRTGSVCDPVRSLARSGPLSGDILDTMPGFTSFPNDFATFWPAHTLLRP